MAHTGNQTDYRVMVTVLELNLGLWGQIFLPSRRESESLYI